MRVGKIAFARAEPGEIEPQHGDAARGKRLGNALRGQAVLAAGEAMREQRIRDRLLGRAFQSRGEKLARRIGEIEAFGDHESPPAEVSPAVYHVAISAPETNRDSIWPSLRRSLQNM